MKLLKKGYVIKVDYVINKGQVLALIPARGGSKGVPKKNIKLLGEYPLIAYSIVLSKLSENIDRVVVTTDSQEIANISKKFGAEVPFLRPDNLAGDNEGDFSFVKHAIDWFQENEGAVPEFIAHIRPTTPLRKKYVVDEAIKILKSESEYTSLRSGHKASESPYKWFVKKDNNCFTSLKEGITNEQANSGRQFFQQVYIPDGYVDVLRTEFVVNNGYLHGDMMYGFESPFCVEVDTLADFHMLEYELLNTEYDLYNYLKENFE